MSSSTERRAAVTGPSTWAPGLDLTPTGLAHFDPARVDRAIEDGYRDGFDAGHAEGVAAGQNAVAAELARIRAEAAALLGALAATDDRLAEHEEATAQAFAGAVTGAAFRIAAAAIGRELSDETVAAGAAVERALGALGRRNGAVVRLHPDDLALVDESRLPEGVHLEPDPGLDRGDAVAHTDDRTVDARLGAALERALAAITDRADPAAEVPS